MSITYNDLISRAEQVRDESEIGANTATRVGQLLADIIQWCQDNNADLGDYLLNFTAHLNESGGILNWFQSRIVLLKTMGGAYDDVSVGSLSDGDVYYDSRGNWIYEKSGSAAINGIHPSKGVFYVNLANKTAYQWDGTTFQVAIEGSSGGGGTSTVTAFEGYEVIESVAELPSVGDPTTGYIVGTHIYAYVGENGDTADGAYQDLGELNAAGVSVTTNGDGTFTIHAGGNDYTVNLNHSHPNMCKLVVCEESDLPSTLDGDTIYGVNEDGEIAMLYVGGLPFYGGGLPAGVPQISMPRPNTVINLGALNGQSGATGTVRIKGRSLTANSTVVVSVGSGFSLSYNGQTGSSVNIDATAAMLGVDVIVTATTYGTEGTMTIKSQTDSILNSYDLTSDVLEELTAIKFTKQQYIVTDIYPGVNTRLEFDMKFDGAGASSVDSNTLSRNFFKCDKHTNGTNVWAMNTNTTAPRKINYYMNLGSSGAVNYVQVYAVDINSARSTLVWDNATDKVTFLNTETTVDHKTVTMDTPMCVGGDPTGKPYGQFDLIIYGIKHYESDVLTHDYTPVRLNGVVGLWDAVSKQFIHSSSGTEVVAVEL